MGRVGVKEFGNGLISVYVDEVGSFGSNTPEVTINWGSIGSVPVERAQTFHDAMLDALIFAVEEEKRLGLRK